MNKDIFQSNSFIRSSFVLKIKAGGKFMLEMRLRQPEFTHNACRPFTRNKEWIQNLKKFIDFVLKIKNLSDYTNLFSSNEYEKKEW